MYKYVNKVLLLFYVYVVIVFECNKMKGIQEEIKYQNNYDFKVNCNQLLYFYFDRIIRN